MYAMNNSITEIFQALQSENYDETESAILAIALLLEKHSQLHDKESFYEVNMTQTLSSMILSEVEIEEIIEKIGQLLLSRKNVSPLVWAIGKSQKISSFKIILAVLKEHYEDENMLWQGLISIETFISLSSNKPIASGIKVLLAEAENVRLIKRVSESKSNRLRQLAERIQKYIMSDPS